MQDPHSRILERYRLRPQKKGRLPNYTKDFEEYTEQINQAIRNQVGFSFQLNKYGMQKRRKMSKLKNVLSMQQRYLTEKSDGSNTSRSNDIKLPQKHLKYNETKIRPDHKIQIRNKSSKKQTRQNSLPVIKEMKQHKRDESSNSNKFPKINLTSRQLTDKKINQMDKENDTYCSKSSRVHLHEINYKDKCYTKLFHIVTMGRKQVKTQI